MEGRAGGQGEGEGKGKGRDPTKFREKLTPLVAAQAARAVKLKFLICTDLTASKHQTVTIQYMYFCNEGRANPYE